MTQSEGCGSAAQAASRILRILRQNDSASLKPALERIDGQGQRTTARFGLEAERWELLEAIAQSLGADHPAAGRRAAEIRLLEHLAASSAAEPAARRRPPEKSPPGRPSCCRR